MPLNESLLQQAIDAIIPDEVSRRVVEYSDEAHALVITFSPCPAYTSPSGESALDVIFSIREDGELLRIETPQFFMAPEVEKLHPIVNALYSNDSLGRTTKFWVDLNDGEVRPIMEIPIEDMLVDRSVISNLIERYLIETVDAYCAVTGSTERSLLSANKSATTSSDALTDRLASLLGSYTPTQIERALAQIGQAGTDVNGSIESSRLPESIASKEARPADTDQLCIEDAAVIIRLSRSYKPGISRDELFRIASGNWAINLDRAKKAEYAYIAYRGEIIEVYKIDGWYETDQLAGHGSCRLRFEGVPADNRRSFIGRSVKHYFKFGDGNPVKYLNL